MATMYCIDANTDISGIGVRTATYAQNLLSFLPAVWALTDGKVTKHELSTLEAQSTTILLTAFALLFSAIIQARTTGLDNYHTTLVLNLSWMNNTNTFIYVLLLLHHRVWEAPPEEWSWPVVIRAIFHNKREQDDGAQPTVITKGNFNTLALRMSFMASRLKKRLSRVDPVIAIGTLHLSLMGVLGIWLWVHPGRFSGSPACSLSASISVFGHGIPLGSRIFRILSLMVYSIVLIPGINLITPTILIFVPYFLYRFRSLEASAREAAAVHCVGLGLLMLFVINVLFITDTELSIKRNEGLQQDQDGLWTFGQTLALLLLVLPLRDAIENVLQRAERRMQQALENQKRLDDAISHLELYSAESEVELAQVREWIRWVKTQDQVKIHPHWLLKAVKAGDLKMVSLLIEKGADINNADNDGRTALECASRKGHLEIVRFLIEKGADVNNHDEDNKTALQHASNRGHLEIVHHLIEKGTNVTNQDNYGQTALFDASSEGHLETVHLLVEKGAHVNDCCHYGLTALNFASGQGHLKIVHFLVENGADVNHQNTFGQTALKQASSSGHLDIVHFLVEKGANLNHRDCIGQTALDIASSQGHFKIVCFLAEKGANIANHDHVGKTALDHASAKGHSNIVRLLLEKGAVAPTDVTVGRVSPRIE